MVNLILLSSIILEPVQKIEAQNSQLKFSFVEKWGSNGSGPSKFVRPHDETLIRRDLCMLAIEN